MNHRNTVRASLGEEACRRFAALALLDRVITDPPWHAALIENPDDYLLDDTFKYMLEQGLVDIGADDHYHATARGRGAYQRMLHQQQSYLMHFDVFAAVDLGEGVFADPEVDNPEDPRWEDLRVAVAEYKGIDAYRMVFLSLLAAGSFFENPAWKFDIALGSSFFKELEEVVESQLAVEELGYEAESGEWVSGEAVIEDVIAQGARVNAERLEREHDRQQTFFDEGMEPENGAGEEPAGELIPFVAYDPWGALDGYLSSPHYVEALWLEDYW